MLTIWKISKTVVFCPVENYEFSSDITIKFGITYPRSVSVNQILEKNTLSMVKVEFRTTSKVNKP